MKHCGALNLLYMRAVIELSIKQVAVETFDVKEW